jgi:FtsH-binding integral membrane protein
LSSIIIIFLITSVLFAIFALIGKFTKIDLSKFWVYLLIGLIAIIVLEIVNIFVLSEKLNMITCILGIIIFLGYIAYDMQRIIKSQEFDGITEGSYPIVFAFNLYIDFINVFIDLMRLFGDSND